MWRPRHLPWKPLQKRLSEVSPITDLYPYFEIAINLFLLCEMS